MCMHGKILKILKIFLRYNFKAKSIYNRNHEETDIPHQNRVNFKKVIMVRAEKLCRGGRNP